MASADDEPADDLRTALRKAWQSSSPRPERVPDPTQFQMAPLGKRNAGSALLCKAMAFYKTRWWERALKSLKDSLARYDKCALAYFYMGITLAKLGKPDDERLAAYRKCIELDPTHFDAHFNLGWMFHTLTKDMDAAETAYTAATTACPNHTDAHFNLALVLVARGDTERADKEFKLALDTADKPEEVIQPSQEQQQQPSGWNSAAIKGSNRRRSRSSLDSSPHARRTSIDQRPPTPREPESTMKNAVAAKIDVKPQAPQEPKPSRSVSLVRNGRTQADSETSGVASASYGDSGENQLEETRRGQSGGRPRSARAGRKSRSLDSAPDTAIYGGNHEPESPAYHGVESAELDPSTRPRNARGGRQLDSASPENTLPMNHRQEKSPVQRTTESTKKDPSVAAQRNARTAERPMTIDSTQPTTLLLSEPHLQDEYAMQAAKAHAASRPRSATGIRKRRPSDSTTPAAMLASENRRHEVTDTQVSHAETSHYKNYDARTSALAGDTTGANVNASAQWDELPSPERSQLPPLANDENSDNKLLNRTTGQKKPAKGNRKHRSMTDFNPEGRNGNEGDKDRVSFLLGQKDAPAGERNDAPVWQSTRALFGDDPEKNEEPPSQIQCPEEAKYKAAIERDASSAQPRIIYGSWLYLRKRDYDAAERQYNAACSVDPNSAEAHYNLGVLLDDIRKNYDEAERAYRRTIELNPKHTAAMNNYAVLLEQVRRDYGAAAIQYKAALKVNPDDPDIRTNYYACLRKRRGSS